MACGLEEALLSVSNKKLRTLIEKFDAQTRFVHSVSSPSAKLSNGNVSFSEHVPLAAPEVLTEQSFYGVVNNSINDFSVTLYHEEDLLAVPILSLTRLEQKEWLEDAKTYFVNGGTIWDDRINALYPEENSDIHGGHTDLPSKRAYVAGRLLGISLIKYWKSKNDGGSEGGSTLDGFINDIADLKPLISFVTVVKRGLLKELELAKRGIIDVDEDEGISVLTTLKSVLWSKLHKQDYRIFDQSATKFTDLPTVEDSLYPDILQKVTKAYHELDAFRFYDLIGPTGKYEKAGAGVHHFVISGVAHIIHRIYRRGIDVKTSSYMDLGCGTGYLLNSFRKTVGGRVWGVDLHNVSKAVKDQINTVRGNNGAHEDFFKAIAIKTGDLTDPDSYILPDEVNIVTAFVGKLVNVGVLEKIAGAPQLDTVCIMGLSYEQNIQLNRQGFSHDCQLTPKFARNSGNGKTIDIFYRSPDNKILVTQRKVSFTYI